MLVALVIGPISLISVLSDRLSLEGGFLGAIADLDLGSVGFVVVGLFALTWATALVIWHFGRIEERWSARLQPADSP